MEPSNAGENRSFIAYTAAQLKDIPSWLPAAFGFAFALSSLEVHRFPVVQTVVLDYSRTTGIATWTAFFFMALLFWKTRGKWAQRPFTAIVLGVIAAAGLFVFYSSESGVPAPISLGAAICFCFANVGLLAIWARNLYAKGPLTGRLIFIASLPLVFVLQLLVGFLTPTIARGACALFPLFSSLLLLILRNPTPFSSALFPKAEAKEMARPPGKFQVLPLALAVAAFVCYNVFFSQMHIDWVLLQREWGALPIQSCSAAGALVAAFLLVVLLPTLRQNRNETMLCQVLILTCALLSLCLASFPHESMALPFYLIALNTSQKLLGYLVFALGFCAHAPQQRTALFCLMYGCCRTGFVLNALLGFLLSPEAYQTAQSVLLVGALGGAVVLLVLDVVAPRFLPINPIGNELQEAPEEENQAAYKEIAFFYLLGQKYGLSQREIEVLPLLVNRMAARTIADELCISQATAKTHIRNIYTKLGVHSQEDLIAQVNQQRGSLFESLPSWYMRL